MISKKLNKAELKTLLSFIEKKGHPYVDVQLEILDHFACKVEDLMSSEQQMKLSEAMDKAYVSFGVYGFSEIADSYGWGLERKFLKNLPVELWKYMKGWYSVIFIVYFSLFGYFVPADRTPFWDGFIGGAVVILILMTLIYILKYRPIYNKYMLYRGYLGLMIPLMSGSSVLLMSGWISEILPLNIYHFFVFLVTYFSYALLTIFERNLKSIVNRVDEMELETYYS